MVTYIALLRGINVSGHNKLKMTDLKQCFIDLGYTNITTYIQSGNVIFQSNKLETKHIENKISKVIATNFNYEINVLVLTKDDLLLIYNSNPFLQNEGIDSTKLHVTLLNDTPNLDNLHQINHLKNNNDEFVILNKTIYVHCPNGYGKTKLTNNLFEKKLNSKATSRNWKTISKLVELSNL
ncbi:DUF1697 domain-containing protein [Lutibacter sp. B1]|uniref:DUF1697 domain-containing protein n=1 Tax=Lutibacter sp. B1 TaxID=2725996 RepID=UPI001456DE89|nr:DUF1697 domain-containing protein [Lutibacter sp. B1]NLP56645.1 DUF1697 domain-containing protein [Lutibacter sp. B1]